MSEATKVLETLSDMLEAAWALLAAGASRRNEFAGRPVLATLSPDGWPEARILVLRHADRRRGALRFFTDGGTDKTLSLAAEPRAAVHIWDPEAAFQLRLSVRARVQAGAVTQNDWDALPQAGVVNYGKSPAPGTPIATPLAYTETRDRAAFAVIDAEIATIEVLHLGDTHRRARFARHNDTGDWTAHWVSP